ncbi:MAG: glycosyltransferase family 2 protein, partial [Brevinema sp.]
VIPVYNVEKYLRECLNSVINQTLKDIEIIIVNDCSPDNSEEIILEYQKKDSRIIYIKHKNNLGLGGARNTGIQKATGKYITFIDSDDFIESEAYFNVISLMERYHANLGLFSAIKFDDLTNKHYNDPFFTAGIDIPTQITADNICDISETSWNKIFETEDIQKNKIYFPEHLKHEDLEFWFKYAAKIKPTCIEDKHIYLHYRQREGSIMSAKNTKIDALQVFLNIAIFFEEQNLFQEYRRAMFYPLQWIPQWYQYYTTEELKEQYAEKVVKIFKAYDLSSEDLYTINPQLIAFHPDKTLLFEYILTNKESKWTKFGKLSRKQKIKKIIAVILKKMKLFTLFKYIYQFLRKK